jgi:outer membrane protein
VLALAVVCWGPVAAAQEAAPAVPAAQEAVPAAIDLEAAVRLALANNPALRAVRAKRDELQGGVVEVRADAYPQLALTSSWARSRSPAFLNSPDFEDILAQFPGGDFRPAEQTLYSAGVEVSQPLFTFGKIRSALDLARLLVESTDEEIRTAMLDAGAEAAVAYFELLTRRESLAAVETQERARREDLAVVEARYEIGEATRLELLRAQSALLDVRPRVAAAKGDVAVATGRLRRALGFGPATPLAVSPPAAAAAGERRELPPPPPLDRLLATAAARRPELAQLALQRQALARQQQVTRAEGKPQIDFNGFFGRQVRLVENLDDPLYDNWSMSIGVRWEFFDGGRRRGQVAQLESQRDQLAFQLADAVNGVLVEIEEERTGYLTAAERYDAARLAAETAREATRVARESYEEGVVLQVDWLDAQQREIEADLVEIDAYYQAMTNAARLSRAIGALPTEGWPLVAPEAAGGVDDAATGPADEAAAAGGSEEE